MKNCAVDCFLLLVLAGGSLGEMQNCNPPAGQDHVLVAVDKSESGHCGGSLLSPEWVLTAAHCNTTSLQVILGHSPPNKGERRKVIGVTQYSDGSNPHNILLLKIEKASAKFSKSIVKLPDSKNCKDFLPKDKSVQFYGWVFPVIGSKGDMIPQKLKCAERKVKDCKTVNYEDKQGVPEQLDHANQKHLCTETKKEECNWYSAGSLTYNGVLRGMLTNYDFKCETQIEFLDICHYRDWIKTISTV